MVVVGLLGAGGVATAVVAALSISLLPTYEVATFPAPGRHEVTLSAGVYNVFRSERGTDRQGRPHQVTLTPGMVVVRGPDGSPVPVAPRWSPPTRARAATWSSFARFAAPRPGRYDVTVTSPPGGGQAVLIEADAPERDVVANRWTAVLFVGAGGAVACGFAFAFMLGLSMIASGWTPWWTRALTRRSQLPPPRAGVPPTWAHLPPPPRPPPPPHPGDAVGPAPPSIGRGAGDP